MKTIRNLMIAVVMVGLFSCEKQEIQPLEQSGYVKIINGNTNDSISDLSARIHWGERTYNYVIENFEIIKTDTGEIKVSGYWTKWVYVTIDGYWVSYFDTVYVNVKQGDTTQCILKPY